MKNQSKIKQKTNGLLLLFAFLNMFLFVNAQVVGKVNNVLNIGSVDYSYIFVEDEGYYKTSAYQAGLLTLGDEVQIVGGQLPNSNYRNFIKLDNSNIGVYAVRIETENFTMPENSVFGVPTVSDDILWFTSQAHFDEFYSIVEDFSKSPYEYSEDLLKVVERQFSNFTSFNNSLRQQFNFEEGLSDDELDLLTSKDYFKDEVLKTVVNQFGEIGIGDKVYTMYTTSNQQQCITLVTPIRNLQLLKDLRDVTKDENFTWNYPFLEAEEFKDGKKPEYILKDLYSVDVVGDIWADVFYTSKISIDPVECSTTKVKVKFVLDRSTHNDAHELLDQGLFAGAVTINWGDGTSTTQAVPPIPLNTDPNGTSTWNKTEVYFTHEYSSEGQYSISSSGVFTSEVVANPTQFNMTDTKDWQTPEVACTASSYSDAEDYSYSANHKSRCEVWIRNFLVVHTIGGKVTNYEKNNKGNWRRRQENLSASVYGVFKTDECQYAETKEEFDSGHERDIQVSKPKWWRNWSIANEDCYCIFTVEHNGSVNTHTIILNPCH